MTDNKADTNADINADIRAVIDRGESIGLMEPIGISESSKYYARLSNLAFILAQKSSGFTRSLPPEMISNLANLVRNMNCYYSNLIEGHGTHPIDIERAQNNDYSENQEKRNLQLEANAHIGVQKFIDDGGIDCKYAISVAGITQIHRQFYCNLPDELKRVANKDTGAEILVEGGKFRETDVKVGRHIAISSGAIPRFLARFEEYFAGKSSNELLINAGAIHHRLAWIHPFLDGNGRVMRLVSHAMTCDILQTGSLWSIARGLARSVETYKSLLANCDLPRRNDYDGRGTLSEEALFQFSEYFLKTCIDQVDFMESLMQPDRLRARISIWADEEISLGNLPKKAKIVLDALLYRGKIERGSEIANLLKVTPRQARRIVADLISIGIVKSKSDNSPITLAFPATLASRLMPGLFPDKES